MASCAACGAVVPVGDGFCGQCGAVQERVCAGCGQVVRPTDRFCPSCGTALVEAPAASPELTVRRRAAGAERRLVSVLFADLVGFTTLSETRDPEDVRALMSLYFARCRAIIERHEGVVEKFIGDAVMAVWGAPVAKEDDAERAVRAALGLTRAVQALGEEVGVADLRLRVGVLTGTAAVGAADSKEGMIHGDTVNTASRLQSIAEPGTVLVDDVTRRTTEAAIAYEDGGVHEVKGRRKPVHTWVALRVVAGVGGARRSAGLEAPLAGRTRELQALIVLGERSASEGCAVQATVTGDAGSGKTRLLWEYFKYVDGIGAERWWLQGRCPSYGDGLAYAALAEMIRGRAGIGEEDDPNTARTKLRSTVEQFVTDERERSLVLPRLAHLLGLEHRNVSEPADLFSGWRLFIERVAATDPVVMVFEDMHRAPRGLLDFIDYLLEWSRELPILVVCLAREVPGERPERGEAITLEPLDLAEMRELLAGLVPGLPEDVAGRIVEQSEGIPLYAVETVLMLLDRGMLVREGARYAPAAAIGRLDVPESLQALAASRLDNLSRGERELLQDAAVLGISFTPEALAAVSGLPVEALAEPLESLVTKQFLARDDGEHLTVAGQYRFLQALLRNVALNTLSRHARRALHLAAAAYLHSLPDRSGESAEVEASHLLDAVALDPDAADADEIRAAAREQLAVAGERTGSLALPDAARSYFEQAADLANDPAQRAHLLAEAGVAATRSGNTDQAHRLLGEAIAGFERLGQGAEAARTQALLADVLIAELRLDDAAALMDAVRESISDAAVLAELAARRARVALLAGDYDRAYKESEAALAIADPAGMRAVVANAQATKAQTLFDQCRLTEAVALCTLALEIGLEAELADQALRAYNNLAYYRLQGGLPEQAVELLDAGIELARERGDRLWERDLISQRISVRAYAGEWDLALAEGDVLREREADMAERVAWQMRPLILAARGDHAALHEWLERELPTSSEWYEQSVDEAAARSVALRAVGRAAQAGELAQSVWAEIRSTGRVTSDVALYLCDLVDGMLEDGHAALMRDVLSAGSGPHPLPAVRGQLAWASGLLRLREGDPGAALEELATAVELLRPVSHPYALARALLDHGECLSRLGRYVAAEASLREAAAIYADLGAGPGVARAERALAAAALGGGVAGSTP